MPVPPVPRLVLVLERTTGVESLAAWELPTDGAVDVTPGVAGVEDALQWAMTYEPQEGPLIDMPSPDSLLFGSDNVAATTTTRFLPAGYNSGSAPTNQVAYEMPVAGTLSDMRVHHGRPGGNGLTIDYTLRVNGVPTALAVNIASTAANGSDLVNSVPVVAGDEIDIQVGKASGIGSSPDEITCTIRVDF